MMIKAALLILAGILIGVLYYPALMLWDYLKNGSGR